MAKKEKNKLPGVLVYFIIATGGQLKKPEVSRMEITDDEIEEYLEDTNETREDAIAYFLNYEIAAYEQHFCTAIAMNEKDFKSLSEDIKEIP